MFLEIITPEKKLYAKEVNYVQFPGSDGKFGVLKNHAPLVSTLTTGEIKWIEGQEEKEESLAVTGGVVEVRNNNIIVLLN